MAEQSQNDSRRRFLSNTGKAALAATAAAGVAHFSARQAAGQQKVPRAVTKQKEIIPGSSSRSYSRAVKLNRTVFVAGCVGTYVKDGKAAIDADFKSQARQTLKNLVGSVEASGSSVDNVLKCTCFLKNLEDFKVFNEIYVGVFHKNPPARSTVIVKDLVVPGALLEVDCVCCVD
jgi:2-iminobutanoate/2-iminopropanoate deaminase